MQPLDIGGSFNQFMKILGKTQRATSPQWGKAERFQKRVGRNNCCDQHNLCTRIEGHRLAEIYRTTCELLEAWKTFSRYTAEGVLTLASSWKAITCKLLCFTKKFKTIFFLSGEEPTNAHELIRFRWERCGRLPRENIWARSNSDVLLPQYIRNSLVRGKHSSIMVDSSLSPKRDWCCQCAS